MVTVGRFLETVPLRIRYWIGDHRSLSAGIFAGAAVGAFFAYLYYMVLEGAFVLDILTGNLSAWIDGVYWTFTLTALSFVFGISLGFLTAYARISNVKVLKTLAKGYVDALRGTPILVQIYLWGVIIFTLTPGYRAQAVLAGIVALTINTGAYQAEIFRGGFKAIQEGQVEAGRALGFSSWQIMKYIKLPQALRLIVPPMTNEFIALLKASALLSAIGVIQVAAVASNIMIATFRTTEPWTIATLLYLSMTVPLAKLVQFLEIRFRVPGLGLPLTSTLAVGRMPPPAAGASRTQRIASPLYLRRDPLYEFFRKRMESRARG
jgi:His/Glu/Gln/Arg/opine family amino acid ABC transporter permease subunit